MGGNTLSKLVSNTPVVFSTPSTNNTATGCVLWSWQKLTDRLNHLIPKWLYQGPKLLDTQSFDYFPRLPTEVKLLIWHFAVSPSLVRSLCHPTNEDKAFYTRTRRSAPAVLQVCREARYELLQHDEMVQDHHTYKMYRLGGSPTRKINRIYMCLELDTLLLTTAHQYIDTALLQSRHLALLQPSEAFNRLAWDRTLIRILPNFTDLLTLTIVNTYVKPILAEVNGLLDFRQLMFEEAERVESQLRRYKWLLGQVEESLEGKSWKIPIVRIRARTQMEEVGW